MKGNDYLYLGLGAGALWLILNNTKPLSATISGAAAAITPVITGASSTISPLLTAAGKGAAIVTDPKSWEYHSYTMELLKAPFTPTQSWRAFKMFPSFSTLVNAAATSLGLWR